MSHAATPDRPVDAIALGASAGGVEALMALLAALPAGCAPRSSSCCTCRAAVTACWWRSSRRAAPCRCGRPGTRSPSAAGMVYFAPPDYHLLLDATAPRSRLSVDEPVHHSRPSIDVLFESAAEVYRERLMGIILTGGNPDGAAGLLAVQRAGGSPWCSEPDDRPGAGDAGLGLQRVAADHVLPLAGIAGLLASIGRSELHGVSAPPRATTRLNAPETRSSACWSTTWRRTSSRLRHSCAATTSRCCRRAPAPRRWSCCSSTMWRSRWSTCRCRRWTASSWPSWCAEASARATCR